MRGKSVTDGATWSLRETVQKQQDVKSIAKELGSVRTWGKAYTRGGGETTHRQSKKRGVTRWFETRGKDCTVCGQERR